MDYVCIKWLVPTVYSWALLIQIAATIAQLQSRKQHYKLSMFKRLHRILMLVVVVIIAFFVVSSFVFSGRLAEGTIRDAPGSIAHF